MFFSKSYTKHSLASIGSKLGKKDHATVLHACKTVKNFAIPTGILKRTLMKLIIFLKIKV
jgi:chromosomal replication initiation ATPase DnaA